MRSQNFTLKYTDLFSKLLSTAFVLLCLGQNLNAQCPLSCGELQVSLNDLCEAEITPQMVLTNDDELDFTTCEYYVVIKDINDVEIMRTIKQGTSFVHPTIDGSFLGTYLASVEAVYTDTDGSIQRISCWNYLDVEDKLGPEIACLEDIVVDCVEELPDELDTETSQSASAETPVEDLNTTSTIIDFNIEVINEANPWELITGITLTLDYDPASLDPDAVTVEVIAPQYMLADWNGTSYDILALNDEQATDDLLSSTWSIRVTDTTGEIIAVEGATLNIDSRSIFLSHPLVNDNCSDPVNIEFISDILIDVDCEDGSPYSYKRVITYQATDESGNASTPCEFTIYFEKPNIYDPVIEFPGNIVLECSNGVLSCDDSMITVPNDWDLNGDGYPDPTDVGVGYPSINGEPFRGGNNLCKINVAYKDQVTGTCPAKILRTWTILDWCESESRVWLQTIKVIDERPPLVVCPPDTLSFTVNSSDCFVDVDFEPFNQDHPTGMQCWYDCSDVTVEVEYLTADNRDINEVDDVFESAISSDGMTFTAIDVPADTFWVKYILTDACGNATECRFEAFVKDTIAPIAICDQFTAVALNEDSWARANAISFDDGSYDACGTDVTFEVRRVETECDSLDGYDRDDLEFGPYVQFCCADAAQEYVQVVLKVSDASGNYSTCQVNVQVQDKHGPYIDQCPQLSVEVDCDQYDPAQLYGNPSRPIVTDNCFENIEPKYEDVGSIDQNCMDGIIIRKWYFEAGNNKVDLTECFQTIRVTSGYGGVVNFPPDKTVECADFAEQEDEPTVLGTPISEYVGCANFAWTFEDLRFYDVEDICFKVVRTHTVIDWCIYEPNSGSNAGHYQDTQVIKVQSTVSPELQECAMEVDQDFNETTCLTEVKMNVPWAYDNCLQEPILPEAMSYDLFNSAGQIIHTEPILTSSVETTPGLQKGSYTAKFFITSGCNNIQVCEIDIDVTEGDTKAPTAYCYGGITTVLMEPNENGEVMVEVWANDFNLGSFDNCTNPANLDFTFGSGSTDAFMVFTCDDIGVQTVRIVVTDECGNSDYCDTQINIQANGNCVTASRHTLGGNVHTEDNIMLEDVEISMLMMEEGAIVPGTTNEEGEYLFEDLPSNNDYSVTAYDNTDHLNGVSTLDLVLIQKHILGTQLLDSPYKMIAADANDSESITAIDLVHIRKLILGIYDQFPDNKSWRFIDEQFTFTDNNNPWPFTEFIEIHDIDQDMDDTNFLAIKVGDVNGSVIDHNIADTAEQRSAGQALTLEDKSFEANETFSIPVYFSGNELLGMQFDLAFNADIMSISGIESGTIQISELNYNLSEEGRLLFSWNKTGVSQLSNEALITLNFTAKTAGSVADAGFKIKDKFLSSEYYTSDLLPKDLSLLVDLKSDSFILAQNEPNPFSESTTIAFTLPEADFVELTLIDYTGRVLYKTSIEAQKGENSVIVESDNLDRQGVIYYSLATKFGNKVKKMLLVK